MRLGPRTRHWITVTVLAAVLGLGYSFARAESHMWVTVARDANYDIQVDTSRTVQRQMASRGRWVPVVETWYRTNHKAPRLHKDKPFNREIVHSVVQCDSLWFKVLSVDMSLGDSRPIAHQVTPFDELNWQPWRLVERETSEEIAARAACHYGKRSGR